MSFALIIEDEILIAISIEDALYDLGYSTCEIATSVQQAVDAAKRRCPDLIVTDHRIAGGTGVEAVREICSHKEIPVVFVTASGAEVREQVLEVFVVDKPFTTRDLETAIGLAADRPFGGSSNRIGPGS